MSPPFGMLVIYLLLGTLGSTAGNHPACGTGRPAIPPTSSMERIVHGVNAIHHEFPWQVQLRDIKHPNRSNSGGSIINSQWILTSAQFALASFDIYAGKHYWMGGGYDRIEKGEQMRKSAKGFVHPKFNVYLDYNIGLIKLASPLSPFPTDTIGPICVPEKSDAIDRFAGQQCILSGWGYNEASSAGLQKVTQPIWKQADCVENIKQYDPRKYLKVTDRMLCLGERGKKQQVAIGDRGNPVVCLGEVNGTQRWMAAGINTFHSNLMLYDIAGLASLHTRVSEVSQWIWETIGKDVP